ncbi:MAG: hypothetical protein GX605_07370, partial [Chloroflexi bacterium]|nr:hypothetical protein [Chloroflexota bacterium]
AQGGRVYIATESAVRGYRLPELTLLWTLAGPPVGSIRQATVDQEGGLLLVHGEAGLLAVDGATGRAVGDPLALEGETPWSVTLLAGHVQADWALLARQAGPRKRLEMVALSTGQVRASLPLWYGEDQFAWHREGGLVAALRAQDHEVAFFGLGPGALSVERTVPTGIEIRSVVVHGEAQRIYLTDSSGRLHVVQSDVGWRSLDQAATLPGRGQLYLDSEHGRLYVSEDHGPATRIYDTDTLDLLGSLETGGALALDPANDRWFLGHEILSPPYDEEDDPLVHVYQWAEDGESFREAATVAQPGIPAYNPLRHELYIVDDTVYVVDPATWTVGGELTSGYRSETMRRCNGCSIISDLAVLPEQNLLVAYVWPISVGKGAGSYPPPKLLDATTRQPITPTLNLHTVACNGFSAAWPGLRESRTVLVTPPVDGLTYESRLYSRYVSFQGVQIRSAGGPAGWVDGLHFAFIDPVGGRGFAPAGEAYLLVSLRDLAPLGTMPKVCLRAADWEAQTLLTTRDARLEVYNLQGRAAPMPAAAVEAAPPGELTSLVPSPDFGRDQTVFATSFGQLYRSRDGGETWQHLQGGLPDASVSSGATLSLAVSPTFAQDQTLFLGLSWGDWQGFGVYRSTDSGDTWTPVWNGLQALRVQRLVVSPEFARDGRVAAYARYQHIGEAFDSGEVLYLTANRGERWMEVARQSSGSGGQPLPELGSVLPLPAAGRQFRASEGGRGVDRSQDGGATWEPVLTVPDESYVQQVLTAPDPNSDPTVFVISSRRAYWSSDGGATWQQAADPRLQAGESGWWSPTVAYVPQEAGGPLLLLASAQGTVQPLHPEDLRWEAAPAPARQPRATPVPTAGPSTSGPCAIQTDRFASLHSAHRAELGCPTAPEETT